MIRGPFDCNDAYALNSVCSCDFLHTTLPDLRLYSLLASPLLATSGFTKVPALLNVIHPEEPH